jgi:hypothetical protein
MGRNKHNRKRLVGLQSVIASHEEKIAEEMNRANPDLGLIAHWMKEIRGWQKESQRLKRRLPRKRR